MANRRHSKISKLPPEVFDAFNRKLAEHYTYKEIVEWLNQLGHPISHSSVGREAQNYMKTLERTKILRDQAKTIVETAAGEQMNLEAAAANVGVGKVLEFLMEMERIDQSEPAHKILTALARLQGTSASRVRVEEEIRRRMGQASKKVAEEVTQVVKKSGLSDKKAQEIRDKILGISA